MAHAQQILSIILLNCSGMLGTGARVRSFPYAWSDLEPTEWSPYQSRLEAALIASGFIEQTKCRTLVVSLDLVSDYVVVRESTIRETNKPRKIWVTKFLRWAQFAETNAKESLSIKAGVVAQAMLDVCKRYGLNETPILEVLSEFPVSDAPLSRLPLQPVKEMPLSQQAASPRSVTPLTDAELSWKQSPFFQVDIIHPLTEQQLERITAETLRVQIYQAAPFVADDYIRIAGALERAPNAQLRIWGAKRATGPSLELLKFFPSVTNLWLDGVCNENVEDLLFISPQLRQLQVSVDNTISLSVLSGFTSLKALCLQDAPADLSDIEQLTSLEALRIAHTLHPDLKRLPLLRSLRSVSICSQSIVDLAPLGEITSVQYLHLANLLNKEIHVLPDLRTVEYLDLDSLCFVEQLPSLASMVNLRRISISGIRKLRDMTAVSEAPNLQDLIVSDLPSLDAAGYSCLRGHQSLKHVWTDLGPRKGNAIEKLLGLNGLGARSIFVFGSRDADEGPGGQARQVSNY